MPRPVAEGLLRGLGGENVNGLQEVMNSRG